VNHEEKNTQNLYLIHHQGQVQGPFDREFIEAMILSRVYSPNVMIQRVGTTPRVRFSQMFASKNGASQQAKASQLPVQQATTKAVPAASKSLSGEAKLAWVVTFVVGLFFCYLFKEISANKASVPKNTPYYLVNSPTQNRDQIPPAVSTYNSNYAQPSGSHSPAISRKLEDTTQVYQDASGRTYRVPSYKYYALVARKAELKSKKQNLDRKVSELERLAEEIDQERRYLDKTSQNAVDSFNRKVDHLNTMNQRVQVDTDTYNLSVNEFNKELARVGSPIY
jgi:hypothetical protein